MLDVAALTARILDAIHAIVTAGGYGTITLSIEKNRVAFFKVETSERFADGEIDPSQLRTRAAGRERIRP